MFKTMLKNQRVQFVSDVDQAMKHSPFYAWHNEKSDRYVVSNKETNQCVAAGLSKEDADAAVMFKANEHIYRRVQNGS